jgi:hypothetical protein
MNTGGAGVVFLLNKAFHAVAQSRKENRLNRKVMV